MDSVPPGLSTPVPLAVSLLPGAMVWLTLLPQLIVLCKPFKVVAHESILNASRSDLAQLGGRAIIR